MAYGNDPQNDTSDAIRLLVGDISTSTSGEFLADGDYDYFTSVTGNTFIAAQLAANSLAALFTGAASSAGATGFVTKQVGDLRLQKTDATQLAQSYRQLAKKLSRMAASKVKPSAGGITRSGKQANRDNSDLVDPFFTRSLMDNKETTPLQLNVDRDIDEVT